MTRKQFTVFIVSRWFVVMDSPDALVDSDGDRCKTLPDYDQNIIWVDPELPADERTQVISETVSRAWAYLLHAAPVAD